MAAAVATVSITTASGDLIAYYNFDEGTGTVAADSIGTLDYSQAQGTVGWTTAGQIEGALSLNGSTSLRGLSPLTPGMTNFSVAFWVQVNAGAGSNDGILIHRPGTTGAPAGEAAPPESATQFWGAIFNNGAPAGTDNAIQWRTDNERRDLTINNQLEFGDWQHVIVTVDATDPADVTTVMYVNGAAIGTQTEKPLGDSMIGATGYWNIGDDPCCGGRETPMLMDELGFFNTTLSDTEVADIYQNQLNGVPLLPPAGDSDGDGIPDVNETGTGTYVSPTDTGTRADEFDSDGDGIGDGDEIDASVGFGAFTDPTDNDTDDDDLLDGFETQNGLDPNDSGTGNPANGAAGDPDNDLLQNLDEQTAGTDPQDNDSDDDTLLDGQEVNDLGSNPLSVDSDGDTLNDADEVNVHSTSPILEDTDDDTLRDDYEVANNLDPNVSTGDDGADGDPDADNLSNENEVIAGTDPQDADSDDDDVNDGDEVDGLVSSFGVVTDPLDSDSDDDGLSDGEEINGTLNVWLNGTRQTSGPGDQTNPTETDTDDDGLSDSYEIRNELDPNDDGSTLEENGGGGDPDGDTLVNEDEEAAGTDPRNPDTDGDTLTDAEEVDGGESNPLLADSDLDGVNDNVELNDDDTDPLDPDTDDDGATDGEEKAAGTDPNDENERPAPTPSHYYPLDAASGSIATDVLGGANGVWANIDETSGDPTNLEWVTDGRIGGAADLQGNPVGPNRFEIAQLTGITGKKSITLSLWARPDTNSDTFYNGIFMTRGENPGGENNWGIAWRQNFNAFDFRYFGGPNAGANNTAAVSGPATPADEGWYHLVLTYNGQDGEIQSWQDGVAVSTGNNSTDFTFTGLGWRIGSDGATQGDNRDFDGRLDDIVIFDRVLPDSDITALYNGGLAGQSAAQVIGFDVPEPPAPVGRIMITSIEQVGDDIVLTLPTPADGTAWEVLSTTDLTADISTWTQEVASTTDTTFTDTGVVSDDDKRFYVIREVNPAL